MGLLAGELGGEPHTGDLRRQCRERAYRRSRLRGLGDQALVVVEDALNVELGDLVSQRVDLLVAR